MTRNRKRTDALSVIAILVWLVGAFLLVAAIALVLNINRATLSVASQGAAGTGTAGVETPAIVLTLSATPAATQTGDPDYRATSFALMTAIPEITASRPTGIFDAGAEFFHEGYRMQNAWQNLVNGYWADVVAGARANDPEQGVIFSSWQFPNAAIGQFYDTPVRAGAVRIIAEQNYRLTLEAANGTLFYWDVPSQRFVTSLTEVVPSMTPPPTHTPTEGPQTPALTPAPNGYPVELTAVPAP
jgi:hypothetical protein